MNNMIVYFAVFRKSWLLKQSQRPQDRCQQHLCLTKIISINKYWLGIQSMLTQWQDREKRRIRDNSQRVRKRLALMYKNQAAKTRREQKDFNVQGHRSLTGKEKLLVFIWKFLCARHPALNLLCLTTLEVRPIFTLLYERANLFRKVKVVAKSHH